MYSKGVVMSQDMVHVKYHVGRFSISDNKASFSVVGVVEKIEKRVSPVFWIFFDSLHDEQSVSMEFNSIGIRSFAFALKTRFKDKNFKYSTQTGGNVTVKNLNIFTANNLAYIGVTHKGITLSVSLQEFELLGLASELEFLVASTVEATYKTQQLIERKKQHNKVENEHDTQNKQ